MSANALRLRALDTFRSAWVCGHLDYQRASDALDAARREEGDVRAGSSGRVDELVMHQLEQLEQEVRVAERRLSEVEAELTGKFDRFCGLGE